MKVTLTKTLPAVMLTLFILTAASAIASAEDPVKEAADQWQLYQKEMEAASEAGQQGDGDAYQKHLDMAQESLQKAQGLYGEANKRGVLDRAGISAYAEVLDAGKNYDLAAELFAALAKQNPDDAEVWLRLGQEYLKLGSWKEQEAIDALNHALDLKPSPAIAARAQYTLGGYFWKTGLYDLAEEAYKKSLESDPSFGLPSIGLAACDITKGRVAEAVQATKALGQMPVDAHIQMQQQFAEAMAIFDKSGLFFKDTAENHLAYAQLLFVSSRPLDSILAVERAVTIEPNDTAAWNFLASVCQSVGQTDRAIRALQRSLAIDPDQPDIKKGLDSLTSGQDAQ